MNKDKTVVALCMPSSHSIFTNTAFDMAVLVATTWSVGVQVHTVNKQLCYLGPSRSGLVEEARSINADYMFFLDSDQRVPPLTIVQLLKHRKDIVGATYVRRTPPFAPITTHDVNGKPLRFGKDKLANVEDLPTGCMLISMKVFDKLERPYFATLQQPGGNGFLGEDTFFCRAAKAAGFRVYCDLELSLKIGHTTVVDKYISS